MAQYYQMAIFTISAAVSSADRGLFWTNAEYTTPRHLLRLPYRDKSEAVKGSFYLHERELSLAYLYSKTMHRSNLMGRGWVFQEWILSRRVLAYADSGLFFFCQSINPSDVSYEEVDLSLELTLNTRLKRAPQMPPADLLQLWYDLVASYSGRSLTHPDKDRILAISGVAKLYKDALKQSRQQPQRLEYVSGLWFGDIHRGLLWQLVPRDSTDNVTQQHRAGRGPVLWLLSNGTSEAVGGRKLARSSYRLPSPTGYCRRRQPQQSKSQLRILRPITALQICSPAFKFVDGLFQF